MSNNNKKRGLIALLLLLAFGLWLVMTVFSPLGEPSAPVSKKPRQGRVEPSFQKEGTLALLNQSSDTLAVIDIELAERPDEIQYGMMYRKSMDPMTGMLFLMGQERPQSFYMKNTYVSLDIIYVNQSGEIVKIIERAEPLNERSLPSERPASMVLEVIGGFSEEHGIEEGQRVKWSRQAS